jgi:hypothetical protein
MRAANLKRKEIKMSWNILIAIAILLAYVLSMIKDEGCIPSSLSVTVFSMEKKDRWIWCLVIWAVVFICLPTYICKVGENTKFLAFLAMAGLLFVGGAPLVIKSEDKMQYFVHCGAAVVCAVCSQLVLVFNQPLLLLAWVPWVVAFVWITKDSPRWRTMTFWGEMVCFANTFTFCLI